MDGHILFMASQISGRFVTMKLPECEKVDPSLIGDGIVRMRHLIILLHVDLMLAIVLRRLSLAFLIALSLILR